MTKILKSLALLTLIVSSVCMANAQSSVWKVTKGQKTIYIAGTIHLLRKSDFPLPDEFKEAYENSQRIVLEADIEQATSPELVQSMLSMMMYDDGRTLQSELKPETYQRLTKAAEEVGLPMFGLNAMKPGMAALSVTMMKMNNDGIGEEGVDAYYLNKAKEDNKDILFLESAEFQMEMLANMGADNPDEYVNYTLNDLDNSSEDFDQLVKKWRAGKTKTILKQIKSMQQTSPTTYQSMLVDRNNNWMPLIEGYVNDHKTEMVMVGNAHIIGPDGIISQLKSKGYLVKQIKSKRK